MNLLGWRTKPCQNFLMKEKTKKNVPTDAWGSCSSILEGEYTCKTRIIMTKREKETEQENTLLKYFQNTRITSCSWGKNISFRLLLINRFLLRFFLFFSFHIKRRKKKDKLCKQILFDRKSPFDHKEITMFLDYIRMTHHLAVRHLLILVRHDPLSFESIIDIS